ncbi:MAG: hypothetical protein M0C28_23065 [Candidatus Moduliflexus flocculans]|nr:hypothetical protein [Candidatus Moduliflexus flocculans]
MRRFWMMLAHCHGQLFNASEIGKNLGVAYTTAARYLDILTGTLMVRALPPWLENIGKRQIKTPKILSATRGDPAPPHRHPDDGATGRPSPSRGVMGRLRRRAHHPGARRSGRGSVLLGRLQPGGTRPPCVRQGRQAGVRGEATRTRPARPGRSTQPWTRWGSSRSRWWCQATPTTRWPTVRGCSASSRIPAGGLEPSALSRRP